LGGWDISQVTDMRNMFNMCYRLKNVGDLSGWAIPTPISNLGICEYIVFLCK